VPLLLDCEGCTPIDIALGITTRTNSDLYSEDSMKDLQLASLFLKNLKETSFLNQGQMMVRSVISCIEEKVPGVGDYLDSRFKAINCMPGEIQESMRKDMLKQVGDIEYGAVGSTPWTPESSLVSQLYEVSGWNCRYTNSFFDLPWLHDFTLDGRDFLEACQDHDDIKFFSHKSIQLLVNHHWEQWQRAVFGLKLIPFTMLLVVFMFWSNLILTHSHSPQVRDSLGHLTDFDADGTNVVIYRKADIAASWFLIIMGCFFMLTEVQAFFYDPKNYII
jgi:hypothetical protein